MVPQRNGGKNTIEKIQQLVALLSAALVKKSLQLQEIQSLVGSLNFFSKGVPNARAFNRRFYATTCGVKSHHHVKLNNELKDIKMCLRFLRLIHENEWRSSDKIEMFTDSTGNFKTLGCGAYCRPGVIGFTGHGPMIGNLLFSISANTSGNLFVGR